MPDMQKGPKVGHTPGPWVLAEDHDREDDEHIVVLAKRRANYRGLKGLWPVCLVGYGLDLEDDKRWLAQCRTNARLIAAAPELLEALEQIDGLRMLLVAEHKLGDAATLMKMKEVIAAAVLKATGGAQ